MLFEPFGFTTFPNTMLLALFGFSITICRKCCETNGFSNNFWGDRDDGDDGNDDDKTEE